MKKIIVLPFFLLLFNFATFSQTYVKVNAITTLLTLPNVGIETSIGPNSTFQFDIMASFWKSVNGKPSQFYIFIPEYRYHLQEKQNGFYAGAHIGGSIYNFQKWNYLNSNLYQKGFGYMIGATIGYEKKINERVVLDCFLGGGSSQGFYKGYYLDSNIRYDKAKDYNKSGEWIPYRGGVMISYRIQ